MIGGKELAPVPMRLRSKEAPAVKNSNEEIIKEFATDQFKIHDLNIESETVNILVTNSKFRSIAQAVGAWQHTQRFTSDDIKIATYRSILGIFRLQLIE